MAFAVGVLALWLGLMVYLLPSLIAAERRLEVLPLVLFRNVTLGWTGVVWLACLWLACRRSRVRPEASSPAPGVGAGPASERVPDWVLDLPRDHRGWRVVPFPTDPFVLPRPR